MGAWGTAIFSDDLACDVRDDYIKNLIKGKLNEEATQLTIDAYNAYNLDEEEISVFWIALALTQWGKGRLTEEVKDKAIEYIDSGFDLIRWKEGSKKSYEKRIIVLEKAREKIISPMPRAKKIPVPSWMHSDTWSVGDLLLYKITSEKIEDESFLGKYIVLRVADNYYYEIGERNIALYAVYAWSGENEPSQEVLTEIIKRPFIILSEFICEGVVIRYNAAITLSYGYAVKKYKSKGIRLLESDNAFKVKDHEILEKSFFDHGNPIHPDYFDVLAARALKKYYEENGWDW